jgi:hypothetical protein
LPAGVTSAGRSVKLASAMSSLSEIRRVLAHRDYRCLWLAPSASVIDDDIVLVALALFVIKRIVSASDLGLVLAAQALPLVAFLLFGRVWADRLCYLASKYLLVAARWPTPARLGLTVEAGENDQAALIT